MIEYLKAFDTHAGYTAYTASTEEFITPNVSVCKAELEVHYTPVPDYSKNYLTTVAKTSGTISFSGSVSGSSSNTLSYSTDNGATWSTAAQVEVNAGAKVLWKGTCTPNSSAGIGNFTNGTATFDVEGNAMSLLFGDDFNGQTSLEGKENAFSFLFSGNTKVNSAENLSLPATTLANSCYNGMFQGCTNLTSAPELPATTLASSCYQSMFWGCTSLTTAPELPATTLAGDCYSSMFAGCTSLTKAPALPATTLVSNCYGNMFNGCTNLNYIKALFTTKPSIFYTYNWVSGVAANGTFVKNSAATWDVRGASGIPSGWDVVY